MRTYCDVCMCVSSVLLQSYNNLARKMKSQLVYRRSAALTERDMLIAGACWRRCMAALMVLLLLSLLSVAACGAHH